MRILKVLKIKMTELRDIDTALEGVSALDLANMRSFYIGENN